MGYEKRRGRASAETARRCVGTLAALVVLTAGTAVGQTYWNRLYDMTGGCPGGGGFSRAVETPGGNFVVAGGGGGYGSTWDGLVLELDAGGNVVAHKYFAMPGSWNVFNGIARMPDGYVVAGYTEMFPAGAPVHRDVWVVRLDLALQPVWQRTYGRTYTNLLGNTAYFQEEANAVVYEPAVPKVGDAIVVVGYTEKVRFLPPPPAEPTEELLDKQLWILVLDPDTGDVLEYHPPDKPGVTIPLQVAMGANGDEIGHAILPLDPANDNWVIAGETNSYLLGANGADFWVLQVTHYLTPVWEFIYGGAGDERAYALAKSGSDIVVGGSESSFRPPFTDSNMWILKLDPLGGVLWANRYGFQSSYSHEARWITEMSNGRLAVAGWGPSSGGSNDLWLLDLEPVAGTPAGGFMGYYDREGLNNGSDRAWSVLEPAGGGFLVVGDSARAGESDLWILKLDTNGDVDSSNPDVDCFLRTDYGFTREATSQPPEEWWLVPAGVTDTVPAPASAVVDSPGINGLTLCTP
jgi:hypothetical protein